MTPIRGISRPNNHARPSNHSYSGDAELSMQAVMVTVLAMDDRLTHLSRLGARTLCGKLAKYETTTSD
jgi:hypothetical protein